MTKEARIQWHDGEKRVPSVSGTGQLHVKEWHSNTLTPYTNELKWTKDINVKQDNIKL